MKTVKELLEISTQYLSNQLGLAIPNARREVELMIGEILHCDRLQVYLRFDQPFQNSELHQLRLMLKRRAMGEPLQWILGKINFCGHSFTIPKNVFIPRPETEEWVDWLLTIPKELFPNQQPPKHILEIGVGSGVILCTLLSKWENSYGVGIDISEHAIAATQSNGKNLGLENRLTLYQIKAGSFQLEKSHPAFDLVVSNPPYIALKDRDSLSKEVLSEPKEALFGGIDGLDAYRTFQKKLPQWGHAGSVYVFEIGIHQKEKVQQILEPISQTIFFRNDLSGIPRTVQGVLR